MFVLNVLKLCISASNKCPMNILALFSKMCCSFLTSQTLHSCVNTLKYFEGVFVAVQHAVKYCWVRLIELLCWVNNELYACGQEPCFVCCFLLAFPKAKELSCCKKNRVLPCQQEKLLQQKQQ